MSSLLDLNIKMRLVELNTTIVAIVLPSSMGNMTWMNTARRPNLTLSTGPRCPTPYEQYQDVLHSYRLFWGRTIPARLGHWMRRFPWFLQLSRISGSQLLLIFDLYRDLVLGIHLGAWGKGEFVKTSGLVRRIYPQVAIAAWSCWLCFFLQISSVSTKCHACGFVCQFSSIPRAAKDIVHLYMESWNKSLQSMRCTLLPEFFRFQHLHARLQRFWLPFATIPSKDDPSDWLECWTKKHCRVSSKKSLLDTDMNQHEHPIPLRRQRDRTMVHSICFTAPMRYQSRPSLQLGQSDFQRYPAGCRVRRRAGSTETHSERLLILGGGIIGVSVAYHLAQRGRRVTVVDHAGLASCASGKAGGFLARNWNDRTPLKQLSQKSFDMHEEVARKLKLKSYRRLRCKSVTPGGSKPEVRKLQHLEWVEDASNVRVMGDESTIAQVHPKELTEQMWKVCEGIGSEFVLGTVNELMIEDPKGPVSDPKDPRKPRVVGAYVNSQPIKAEKVICCMGPWAQVIGMLLPKLKIYGQKCHSVCLQTERVLSEAVFFAGLGNFEVYPRNTGENYVTGFPDPVSIVTEPPGNVLVRREVCEKLVSRMSQVSPEMRLAKVTAEQSCYLPLTADTFPAMGPLPGYDGGYLCVGHGCWGILNSLASGMAMSELILDGEATSLDLKCFDPERLLLSNDPDWAPSWSLRAPMEGQHDINLTWSRFVASHVW